MDKFPCSGCGLCCMKAGLAVMNARKLLIGGEKDPYVKEVAEFPFLFTPEGRCSKLADDNKTCTVYESRPDICNVEKMFDKYYEGKIDKQSYYLSSAMACNKIIKNEGASEEFFLDVNPEKFLPSK